MRRCSSTGNCVRALSQELGVAPLEETTGLFEQVSEGGLAPSPAAAPSAERAATGAPRELALVGRDSELDALLAAHRAAARGGVLAVVEGEAGIGKTRLCRRAGYAARAKGALVMAARCHEDEAGLPYAPIVELLSDAVRTAEDWVGAVSPQRLADASRLLPELAALRPDLPKPHSLSAPRCPDPAVGSGCRRARRCRQRSGARRALPRRRARCRRGDRRLPRLPRTKARPASDACCC